VRAMPRECVRAPRCSKPAAPACKETAACGRLGAGGIDRRLDPLEAEASSRRSCRQIERMKAMRSSTSWPRALGGDIVPDGVQKPLSPRNAMVRTASDSMRAPDEHRLAAIRKI
jgi:hypothetical protein